MQEESRDEEGERLGERVRLQQELIRAQDRLRDLVLEEAHTAAMQVRAHLRCYLQVDMFVGIHFRI